MTIEFKDVPTGSFFTFLGFPGRRWQKLIGIAVDDDFEMFIARDDAPCILNRQSGYWRERSVALDEELAERLDEVRNLAMLLRRFIHTTRNMEEVLSIRDIRDSVKHYLKRKGLQGDILR